MIIVPARNTMHHFGFRLAELPQSRTFAAAREPGLPPADVLIYRLPGARVVIRPSGTEPKLKAYLEVVEPATLQTLAAARMAAAERLGPLRTAVADLVAEG